jgi:two-component system sensor histidine kinase/response regulator
MHANADGPRRSRSGGSAVLIVCAAEASATELTDFFVDRVGAELASDPDDAERLVRAATGRAQPYRLILIVAAAPMFVGLATRIKGVPGTEGMKILLLADQPASSGEREVAVDAVVPDSVGLAQLVQMVRQLAGISLPDPDEPPSGAVERVGTVLLVEDDLVSQRLTSSMLTELGIDCQIVGNGRAAVAAAQQQDFDAVLMDCMMPGLDGYAATRLLRTLPGKVSQLPVIAMSASDSEEDRRRRQDAGMDGYLPKPFDIGQLSEPLRRWMPAVARPDVRLPDQSDGSESAADAPAAEDAGAADDPIDGVALAKLADRLPADRMARLVGTFLGETPKLLQRMTAAAAADDFAELQLAAHSLKGSSAFLGAAQLSGSAKAVEQAAMAELAAAELISETTAAFEQARLALLDRYPTAASV